MNAVASSSVPNTATERGVNGGAILGHQPQIAGIVPRQGLDGRFTHSVSALALNDVALADDL